MLKASNRVPAFTLLATALFFSSCGTRSSTPVSSAGALPSSWYTKPEEEGTLANDNDAKPSARTDRSVDAAFATVQGALDQIDEPSPFKTNALPLTQKPSDWTPWHLDGMIADFAVSTSGIFGLLLGGGVASIKGTWQQPGAPAPSASQPMAVRGNTIHAGSQATSDELMAQIEPAIQSAISAGAVKNEAVLRASIREHVDAFLSVGRALDQIHVLPGWHVDSLQLQMTLNGQGQVTPVLGVGSTFNVYFDWQMQKSPAQPTFTSADPKLTEALQSFAEAMVSEIPGAATETTELQKTGLVLDQFQLGLAVTAQGNVGLAQGQGTTTGKLIFKKDSTPAPTPAAPLSPAGTAKQVDLIAREASFNQIEFAEMEEIPYETVADNSTQAISSRPTVFHIDRNRFHNGLKKAFRMASYFASEAKKVDSRRWQISQIESEFDASIGGDLKLATLSGTGQIVIDLDRPNP